MKEIRNQGLERLLDHAKVLRWGYSLYNEPEGNYGGWHRNERNYAELRKISPAGEDFSMVIDFDMNDTVGTFLDNLDEYAGNFDVDEHVEVWMPERGKGGCPGSISELVRDAEAIRDMIVELYENLSIFEEGE